jgi:hypothetical protein
MNYTQHSVKYYSINGCIYSLDWTMHGLYWTTGLTLTSKMAQYLMVAQFSFLVGLV